MTHLALPMLVQHPESNSPLCFATARDEVGRSQPVVAHVEVDGEGTLQLAGEWKLVAGPGKLGHFDEAGLSLSGIVPSEGGFECLTFGWRLRAGGGWFNEIGHLTLNTTGAVVMRSLAPSIARTAADPISMAYPVEGEGGTILYCAPRSLDPASGRPADFVVMRKGPHGREMVLLPEHSKNSGIFALTRPWPDLQRPGLGMWLCAKGENYKIYYVSLDAEDERGTKAIFKEDLTALNDENEMGSLCYPSVTTLGDREYLLYNGAGYGRTGFGVAMRALK